MSAGSAVEESWEWVAGLGVRLAFRLDGLSLLFALLVTGIGALVLIYGGGYLKGDARLPRFYAAILFFMAAMLGLVLADDALALFVFWELTSVSSYLLIGFDHHREEARKAALQALFVTGAGGLALLAGLLLIGEIAGTLQLSALGAQAPAIQAHALYLPALLLVLLGAFTKSAQFPFHFWLPGAMAAPSPVSAYLHSATMVKAGVYLLARLNPALGGSDAWHYLVILAGTATLVTGAVLAYGQTDLKRLLAFTTVGALGTLTLLLGISTELSARAAMVFLLVHALYKAALFLGVGTIDHEAGTRDVRLLGGLARAMPLTAVAVVASALSMAGLPPLFGFVAKELFYEAKQEAPRAGQILAIASFAASALVAAAAGLVGWRPFFGPKRGTPKRAHEAPAALWLGPVVLAGVSVTLGLLPDLLATPIVEPAVSAVRGERTEIVLVPWLGMSPALAQSLLMLATGALLYALHDRALVVLAPLRALASRGPARAYEVALSGIVRLAKAQTRLLQSGVLGRYLVVTVGTMSALGAYALATRVAGCRSSSNRWDPARRSSRWWFWPERSRWCAPARSSSPSQPSALWATESRWCFSSSAGPTSPSRSSPSKRSRCCCSCWCCAACRASASSRLPGSASATDWWQFWGEPSWPRWSSPPPQRPTRRRSGITSVRRASPSRTDATW